MDIFFVAILILSVGPGLLLASGCLLAPSEDRVANRCLAALSVSIAHVCSIKAIEGLGWGKAIPTLMSIPLPFGYLVPALFYLYIFKLLHRDVTIRTRLFRHSLPFLACSAIVLPFQLSGVESVEGFLDQRPFGIRWWLLVGTAVAGVYYLEKSWREIRAAERALRDRVSNMDKIRLDWLSHLLFAFGVTWLGGIIAPLIFVFGTDYEAIMLAMACWFLYAIGLYAMKHSRVFQQELSQAPDRKYATSGVDPEAAKQKGRELLALLVRSKLFRNPNLSLSDLAVAAKLGEYQTSQALNVGLGENFYGLINRLRAEDARRLLADPTCKSSILAIAYEVGFNSKSAFNHAFRRLSGKTPSEFRADPAGSRANTQVQKT